MTNKLNLYQLIFALLLVLKMGDVPGFEFSWFVIISPLIIGSINGFVWRLLEATKLPEKARNQMLGMYLNSLNKRVAKRELKKYKDEQTAKYSGTK